MSLDGVNADPADVAGRQLNWHGNGEAAALIADPQLVRRDVREAAGDLPVVRLAASAPVGQDVHEGRVST